VTQADPAKKALCLAGMIALGIGLHNLGEGLAIGAAFAIGEAALGSFLVIGFMLHNVTERTIDDGEITTRQLSTLAIDTFLSADQVGVLGLPPYSLSTPDLIRYIEALKESGQDADPYAIALWRKISVPLATGAMALLALSFVFGSTRSISAGYRITIGSLVGIVLYFVDQMSIQWGLLLNLSPVVTAMLPVLLISGITFVRLRKAF
jgi:lipopolysaccharide export system permease protein